MCVCVCLCCVWGCVCCVCVLCVCVCMRVYECVCTCMHMCMHACVCMCVYVYVCKKEHVWYMLHCITTLSYLQRGSKHKEKWMKEENSKFKSLHKQIDDGCYNKLGKPNLERREGRQIQSLARVWKHKGCISCQRPSLSWHTLLPCVLVHTPTPWGGESSRTWTCLEWTGTQTLHEDTTILNVDLPISSINYQQQLQFNNSSWNLYYATSFNCSMQQLQLQCEAAAIGSQSPHSSIHGYTVIDSSSCHWGWAYCVQDYNDYAMLHCSWNVKLCSKVCLTVPTWVIRHCISVKIFVVEKNTVHLHIIFTWNKRVIFYCIGVWEKLEHNQQAKHLEMNQTNSADTLRFSLGNSRTLLTGVTDLGSVEQKCYSSWLLACMIGLIFAVHGVSRSEMDWLMAVMNSVYWISHCC